MKSSLTPCVSKAHQLSLSKADVIKLRSLLNLAHHAGAIERRLFVYGCRKMPFRFEACSRLPIWYSERPLFDVDLSIAAGPLTASSCRKRTHGFAPKTSVN